MPVAAMIAALLLNLLLGSCSGEASGPNRRPVAVAGPDLVLYNLETAKLDGSRSFDPDGDVLRYRWELLAAPEDSSAEITDAESERAALTPEQEGLWVIRLIVSDDRLESLPDVVHIRVLFRNCVDDEDCDDGIYCNGAEICDRLQGCTSGPNEPSGAPCDDGDDCTAGEHCDGAGKCVGGTTPDADDDGYYDKNCGGDDCDDQDPLVNPGAQEGPVCDQRGTCHDGADNDCDGLIDRDDAGCQASGFICLYGPDRPIPLSGGGALKVVLDGPDHDPQKIVCYTDDSRLLPRTALLSNDFETDLSGFTASDPTQVYRSDDAQNPESSGSFGIFICEYGGVAVLESNPIDTRGHNRIMLRYAARAVETEDYQPFEFFIAEYSPDGGSNWHVLDIQGDGLIQGYFQWFSHILPQSCANIPNLKIRFRAKGGNTASEGGHLDDVEVLALPAPTVSWTIASNRFETSQGNSPAGSCLGDTIAGFNQNLDHLVCLQTAAQNPATRGANDTQGVSIFGQSSWINYRDGLSTRLVPRGSDLLASFWMSAANLSEEGYANAWYNYKDPWRRMNGVGVDTTVESGASFRFLLDPKAIGERIWLMFWIPWSAEADQNQGIYLDDFRLSWHRASHDRISPFFNRGDGTYTATITSDLAGSATVTCIYHGSKALITNGNYPNSPSQRVEFH